MVKEKYTPYTQEQMDALRARQKGQGSFHHTLIECWFLADDDNKQALEEAFPKFLTRTTHTSQYELQPHKGKDYMQGKKIFDR